MKVAAEDASGIGEGEEFHKGTTDTKKKGSMRNWMSLWHKQKKTIVMAGKGVEKKYLVEYKIDH